MAWCEFAVHRPLPENKTEPFIKPRVMIFHSAAVNVSSLYDAFNRSGNNIESHFFVKWDGVIEQYMDTNRQADANRYANDFAISVETEDDGDPNRQPWTEAQMDAMVRLGLWGEQTHIIPRKECEKWNGSGFGYHTMWGSPSKWTPVAKSCPGTIRIKQYKEIVLPRIIAGVVANPPPQEEPDMEPMRYNVFTIEGRGNMVFYNTNYECLTYKYIADPQYLDLLRMSGKWDGTIFHLTDWWAACLKEL